MSRLSRTEKRRLRAGFYTDEYFLKTTNVLMNSARDPYVVMQIFAKKEGVLAGVEEVKEILEHANPDGKYNGYTYHIAEEGSEFKPRTPVLYIEGNYLDFAHLETPILGILARRSLIATNARKVKDAAGDKPVMLMSARHDDFRVQKGDGYAALAGGVDKISTAANAYWTAEKAIGTMPHSMIAAFGGSIVDATVAFHQTMLDYGEEEARTISLVDYNNNCVADAVRVAGVMEEEFGPGALYAVRLDTSESLADKSLQYLNRKYQHETDRYKGVNPVLVRTVRGALDDAGFEDVKIIVSGGFTPEKIKHFEDNNTPVDGYGVGSYMLQGSLNFTADIVAVNGEPEAKVGREYWHNPEVLDGTRLV